jgi:hypothetical protein
MPDVEPIATAQETSLAKIHPLRCFSGALVSATIGLLAYRLLIAIATTFANKPITSDSAAAQNIGAAVRTLVLGIAALGVGVFGIAALGLTALGLQLTLQRLRPPTPAE